jgi:uncharacterized protein
LKRVVNRTPIDLDEALRRITSIRAGLAIHGVRNLGVFGSVARRDAGPDSDVDVIIDLDPDHQTLDDLVAVADLLEATLGTHVDLVTRNGVSPYIAPTIESEALYVRIS